MAETQPIQVSVALATYNGARYLPQQLESLLAQTRLPDELVIGDDGSRDETAEIIAEFTARAPFPVRLTVNEDNLGPARNFIATTLRCTGSVVFFCDQDDVWHPEKVARMLSFMAENPGKWMALHDAAIIDGTGAELGVTLAGQIRSAGGDPAEGHIAGCCMALDARLAALFSHAGNPRLHDSWIEPIARRLGLVAYLDRPLIGYRRHGANVSTSFMSETTRAGALSRFVYRAATAFGEEAQTSLRITHDWAQDARRAIEANRAALLAAIPDACIAEALEELAVVEEATARRLTIHKATGSAVPKALRACWSAGDYRSPSGKLSLLRDLYAICFPRSGN